MKATAYTHIYIGKFLLLKYFRSYRQLRIVNARKFFAQRIIRTTGFCIRAHVDGSSTAGLPDHRRSLSQSVPIAAANREVMEATKETTKETGGPRKKRGPYKK